MRHAPGPAVPPASPTGSSPRRRLPIAAAAACSAASIVAFAPPAVAQDMTNQLEASIRLGFEIETEPDTSFAFEDFASRIRWNGERRISDTLVGLGYLEFGFDQDTGIDNTRYAYIGAAGTFGTITGGKQYRAFYDLVTSVVDIAYIGSCEFDISCARQDGVIKYERAFGPELRVAASTTLVDGDIDDDFLDEIDVGAIYQLGDISVGAALTFGNGTAAQQPEDVIEIDGLGSSAFADGGLALGVSASTELREDLVLTGTVQLASEDYLGGDDDGFGFTVTGQAERFYGLFSLADFGITPFYATLGYEYPIDDDSLIYAEIQGVEPDVDGADFELFLRTVYIYNFGAVEMISRDR